MLLQMIKAINTNKSTENVNLLDAMKILAECWYDVNEEIVKKCFTKSRISPKDQGNTQNDLDHWFFELRSNIEKLKSLSIDEILEEFTPEELGNLTVPLLQRNLVYLMSQSLRCYVKLGSQQSRK